MSRVEFVRRARAVLVCPVVIACTVFSWSCQSDRVDVPDLALLPADVFADIRTRVRNGDDSVAGVADSLRAHAEAMMDVPLASPLDKPLLPPSGDKKDYLTRAPYFWPNPETANGLPYVKRDGRLYPENRSGTDFVGRNRMEQIVLVLGQAFYFLGDEEYAERAARQLRVWFLDDSTSMNPHLEYSQGVPGIMPGSEWGTIDTWRWSVLIDVARLLDDSPSWTSEDRRAFAEWLQRYGRWLEESELGTRAGLMWNNHGTFRDAQLAAIALYAGDDERAREILEQSWHVRIDHGIEGDGRQLYELDRTRSFGYSNFNLRAYYYLAALGKTVGLDLWRQTAPDGSGLQAATHFLGPYAAATTEWPYVDITFDAFAILPVMRWAYVAYDDPAYLDYARAIPGYDERAAQWPERSVDLFHAFLPR